MEIKVPGKALMVAYAAIGRGWQVALTTETTPSHILVTATDGNRSIEAVWNRDGTWSRGVLIRPERLNPRKLRNAGEAIRILNGENV